MLREVNRVLLRERLNRSGLPRWYIAEQTGLHVTTLRRWLSGRIQRPSKEKVRVLEAFLAQHS